MKSGKMVYSHNLLCYIPFRKLNIINAPSINDVVVLKKDSFGGIDPNPLCLASSHTMYVDWEVLG